MDIKSALNVIKAYKFKSSFVQYILIILIPLLVLFMFVVGVIYQNDVKVIKANEANYTKRLLDNISYNFNAAFSTVTGYYYDTLLNVDNQIFMKTNTEMSKKQLSDSLSRMYTDMSYVVNNNEAIDSVYVYSKKANYVLSYSNMFSSNMFENFMDKDLISSVLNNGDTMLQREIKLRHGTKKYFTICRQLKQNNDIEGVLVVNLNHDKIYNKPDEQMIVRLVDKNGTIIFSSDDSAGKKIDEISPFDYNNSSNDFINVYNKSGEIIGLADYLEKAHVHLLLSRLTPNTGLQEKSLILKLILLAFAMILIAIAVSFIIVLRFYDSFFRILKAFQKPLEPLNKNDNEFSFIYRKIVSILKKSEDVETELARRIALLNRTQVAYLQAQINPHFLFNTLHLINAMEVSSHKAKTDVSESICILSELLRGALDIEHILIPLTEEIKYCNNYLKIQKLRLSDSFEVNWCIDKETQKMKVLKFSLQPILENAISHGLKTMNNGIISIKTSVENDVLVIEISDNGCGIDKDRLEELKKQLSEATVGSQSNVGLPNVNQRVKLLFGQDYGCDISSDESGTSVLLKMPKITE